MLRLCSRNLVNLGVMKNGHPLNPAALVSCRKMSKNQSLAKLPVPPLKQTCDMYLDILQPVLEPEELQRAKRLVDEFQKEGGVGERLQRGLEKKAEETDNWLIDDYVLEEYLRKRKPLPIFSNMAAFIPSKTTPTEDERIRSAADVILSFLNFNSMLQNGTFPFAPGQKAPLCLKQQEELISSCRIPHPQVDSLVLFDRPPKLFKHVSVVRNSQFFALDVFHDDWTPLSPDELCVQLKRIHESSAKPDQEPVGIMTSQHRDVWAKVYEELVKDKTNKESLFAIESSIFTLCFDGPAAPVADSDHLIKGIKQMMTGDGGSWNSSNRWFDKGMQIIFGLDGVLGMNGSHTVTDGIVGLEVFDVILNGTKKEKPVSSPVKDLSHPKKLKFNISPEIKEEIEKAKQNMDVFAQGYDIKKKVFQHFGKNFLKSLKVSPDCFMQMAVQLAYFRTHKHITPVLEPVSMRMFKGGRLGIVHPTSSFSAAFVKAFDNPMIKDSEKVELLVKSIEVLQRSIRLGHQGHTMDTHFFGLKTQAINENIPVPEIFTDVSYEKVFNFQILASQVTTRNGIVTCSSPEWPGLYDVNYGIMNDYIEILVSCFKYPETCREKNSAQMIQAMEDALLDMRTLMERRLEK